MNNTELPKPRLFQISIKGKTSADGPDFYIKELQLVTDDHDLEMSIVTLSEDLEVVESVHTSEIEIGYSAFCHDAFVTGIKALH